MSHSRCEARGRILPSHRMRQRPDPKDISLDDDLPLIQPRDDSNGLGCLIIGKVVSESDLPTFC